MNYKRITVETLAKAAIALCSILAIAVLVSTFQHGTFDVISYYEEEISDLKLQVAQEEELIEKNQNAINSYEEKLSDLIAAENYAKKNLNEKKSELKSVCSRSYYSYNYCSSRCRSYHNAVDIAEDAYDDAVYDVSNCEDEITFTNKIIKSATDYKETLNDDIKAKSALKAKATWKAFFIVVAMLCALAGIVFICRFLLNRENRKDGLIACAAFAGSSFLYMVTIGGFMILTHIFGMIIFAILAGLISEEITMRITARVFVIILSLAVAAISLVFAPVAAVCFAIAFILISLVLVPCVFTEYLDIGKHIFFTIITYGIWHLIWMYNVTENLNKVEEAEKRAPVKELILCALLPLYYIFWTYKTAGNTEIYGKERGKSFKIEILCLALSVISPLLASIIIQDKTNTIVGAPVQNTAVEQPVAEEATEVTAPEVTAE